MALRLQRVPATRGLVWMRQGLQVYARRPLAFTALLLAFFTASLVMSALLPEVGRWVVPMSLPLLNLAFMAATQQTVHGSAVRAGQFAEALRRPGPRRRSLLVLCVVYGLAFAAITTLADMLMGDASEQLRQLYAVGTTPTTEAQQAAAADPRLLQGFGLLLGGLALLSIPFWHAPALVLWGEQGAAQSVFSSTLACWHNKGALALYAAVWFATVMLLGLLTTLVFAAMGMAQAASLAMLPLGLTLTAVFYVTQYFIFVDSFSPA
jgi:hypothetical protein